MKLPFFPKALVISLAVGLGFVCQLKADTLYMKDGSQRSGTIVGQTRTTVRLKGLDGKVATIPKAKIKRILFENFAKEQERRRKEEERRKKEAEKKRQEEARRKAEEERKRKLEEEKRQKEEAERRKQEEEQKQKTGPITRMEALKRSAMLPGWGQWSRGEKLKGGFFGGGAALFLYLSYEQNRLLRNTVRDTESMFNPGLETAALYWATNTSPNPTPDQLRDPVGLWLYTQPFEKQHAKLEKQVKDLRLTLFTLFAIYGWNLADAWYFHPSPAVHLKTNLHHLSGWQKKQGDWIEQAEGTKSRDILLASKGQSLALLPGMPEYLGVPIQKEGHWKFLPVLRFDGPNPSQAGSLFGGRQTAIWKSTGLRQEFVFRRTLSLEGLF